MHQSCRTLFYTIFLLSRFINDCQALRDLKINVPLAVVRGKDAELECSYDLEGERLYSVKWYRGGHEFFRYTPKDTEPIKIFYVKDINVSLSESTDTKVVLENVSRHISGPFSCEVTAEKPSFFTAMQTAELQVVDIPKKDPRITGLKKRYTLENEVFQANCTSENSYPAANITWYINGLQIRGPQVSKRTVNHGKFLTIVSIIRHRLTKDLFTNRRMKLKCLASIYDVYHRISEISVELVEKRRKNYHPDWQPTTKAPPVEVEEVLNNEDEYENSIESPPRTTLWFWSPSSASCSMTYSVYMLFFILVIPAYAVVLLR